MNKKRLGILIFWLLLWQVFSTLTDNDILFVGPLEVLRSFFSLVPTVGFWQTVAVSLAKISAGFWGAFLLGIILGGFAYRYPILKDFLAPVMAFTKSVPVASFVILALIWTGSRYLSVLIAFIVVLPIIYTNFLTGLENTDRKLLEMAGVFHIGLFRRFFFLYRPAVLPYLSSGCKVALGMSWKSGVAAEVIGLPDFSIGERLYMSKIYLNTADLFAWTLVIILLSLLFEKLFLWIIIKAGTYYRKEKPDAGKENKKQEPKNRPAPFTVQLQDVNKAYNKNPILNHITLNLKSGETYCLMGPSGSGKTTLLHILLDLVKVDGGAVIGREQKRCSAVFQENRLCEHLSAIDNIRLVCKDRSLQEITAQLSQLLPGNFIRQPVSTYSGGMKRRVAICRAVMAQSDIVVMDEPFTGLDSDTKQRVIRYIRSNKGERLLLLSTHQEEDLHLLGGKGIQLKDC